MKTPEERSEVIEKAARKAKKGYKVNTDKRRKDISAEEMEIITVQLLALKVVGGYSNLQCAAIVGISKGQVSQIINDEKFKKQVAGVRKGIPQATIALGQAYLVETLQAVIHVIRTENDNALVLRAAAEMFDRFGIPKLTRSEAKVENPTPDGGGLDIPTSVVEKLRAASPEVQEKIAALHESFSEGVERIMNGASDGDSDSS